MQITLVRWRADVALLAVQLVTEHPIAAFLCNHPRTNGPRRIMADMLVVATFKFSNPVLFFVKVKPDNPFLHVPAKRQAPTSPIGAVIEPRGRQLHGVVFKKNKDIGWG